MSSVMVSSRRSIQTDTDVDFKTMRPNGSSSKDVNWQSSFLPPCAPLLFLLCIYKYKKRAVEKTRRQSCAATVGAFSSRIVSNVRT